LAHIRYAIAGTRATGTEQFLPQLHGILAEAHLRSRRVDVGLAAIDEALGIVQRTGERFHEAELHRLHGELLLAASSAESVREAERAFAEAIAVARTQGARLLVLRAAVSVGRCWGRLGRGEEARHVVDSAMREMDEPLASADAIEANALLGD
jgi:predicted ATPase